MMHSAPGTAAQVTAGLRLRMAWAASHAELATRIRPSPAWVARIRGVLGGFGPGHAFVGAGEVVVHAVPGMVQRDLGERFTYIPMPNWARSAASRLRAQGRAARFLRPVLARSAPGVWFMAFHAALNNPVMG